MAIVFQKTLRTSAGNLSWIASLATHREVVQSNGDIVLDFSNVREFDENLCAVLGVLVERWKSESRCVRVQLNAPEVLAMFKRNGFLSELSLPRVWYDFLPCFAPDRSIQIEAADSQVYEIPYKKFGRTDMDSQTKYVERLLATPWWPEMTAAVRDALTDNILEVFNNAEEHSESEHGVFVCGHIRKLGQRLMRVSIADAGIGFRKKIEMAIGKKMLSSQAIAWGMKEGNTVRKSGPGGLGLKLLKEFISKNDGRLSVLSDRGYWELSGSKERMEELDFSFPGTVVTIAVNTEDQKSYRLASEAEVRK